MKQEKQRDQEPFKEENKELKAKKDYPPLCQKGGTYFHCGSIIGHKNVFVTDEYIDILANAFRMAEVKRDIKNLAYVIMPNFFYWMFRLSASQDNPCEIYGELKKDVAMEVLRHLKEEMKSTPQRMADLFRFNTRVGRCTPEKILASFEESAKEFPNNKKYRVWAPKTEIRLLDNDELINQKLAVMKKAPTTERWQLVENPDKYPYSYFADELADRVISLEMPAMSVPIKVAV